MRASGRTFSYVATALAFAANLTLLGAWLVRADTSNYVWAPVPTAVLERIAAACRHIFWTGYLARVIPLNLSLVAVVALSRSRRRWTLATALAVAGAALFVTARAWSAGRLAADYLVLFENQSVGEPYLVRPIEEAGPAVGPLLIDRVRVPGYPLRRYAMDGLGKIRYAPAAPALGRVLLDRREEYWMRGAAYEALVAIDTSEARHAIDEFRRGTRSGADSEVLDYLRLIGAR